MIDLVTLTQAKLHLHQDGTYRDTDIQLKISAASAIVMRHMKLDDPLDEWANGSSPETYEIPANIQAWTLLILGELFEVREAGAFNIEKILALIPRVPTQA